MDFVSKVVSTLIGFVSIDTLIITLGTKSHNPLSKGISGAGAYQQPLWPDAGRQRADHSIPSLGYGDDKDLD